MTKKTITAFALLTVLSCLFRPTNCVTSASMAEQQGDTANRELRHRRKRGGSGRKRGRRHRKRAHWGHGRCEFALPRVRYVSPTECHPYRITTTNDFCSSTKKGATGKITADRRGANGTVLTPGPGHMTGTGPTGRSQAGVGTATYLRVFLLTLLQQLVVHI